jgi:hypothetical protein
MGQFVSGTTKITFGSRKTPDGYVAVVHIDGVSYNTQIPPFKHQKTAWRNAKRIAHQQLIRAMLHVLITKPADLQPLKALLGGNVPVASRTEPLNYIKI